MNINKNKTNKTKTNKTKTNKTKTKKNKIQNGGYSSENLFESESNLKYTLNSTYISNNNERFIITKVKHKIFKLPLLRVFDIIYNKIYDLDFLQSYHSKNTMASYCLYDDIEHNIYCFQYNKEKLNNTFEVSIKSSTDDLGALQQIIETEINSGLDSKQIIQNLLKKGILYFKLTATESDCINFNKEDIDILVNTLNTRLEKKCTSLKIMFDNYEKLNNPEVFNSNNYGNVLCLYHTKDGINKCVSTIKLKSIKKDPNENNILEFSSQTSQGYSNLKFNKLLRAVLIILLSELVCEDQLKSVSYIYSDAVNPISAWLLFSSYVIDIYYSPSVLAYMEDYYDQDLSNMIRNKNYSIKNPDHMKRLYDFIINFYKGHHNIEIFVNIQDNIEAAKDVFAELLKEYSSNNNKKSKTLGCPE